MYHVPSNEEVTCKHSLLEYYSQYKDLERKKEMVRSDKDKIVELIKLLDQKKNEALKTAWKKVNKVNIMYSRRQIKVHVSSLYYDRSTDRFT